jgi:hypothetical protein
MVTIDSCSIHRSHCHHSTWAFSLRLFTFEILLFALAALNRLQYLLAKQIFKATRITFCKWLIYVHTRTSTSWVINLQSNVYGNTCRNLTINRKENATITQLQALNELTKKNDYYRCPTLFNGHVRRWTTRFIVSKNHYWIHYTIDNQSNNDDRNKLEFRLCLFCISFYSIKRIQVKTNK